MRKFRKVKRIFMNFIEETLICNYYFQNLLENLVKEIQVH